MGLHFISKLEYAYHMMKIMSYINCITISDIFWVLFFYSITACENLWIPPSFDPENLWIPPSFDPINSWFLFIYIVHHISHWGCITNILAFPLLVLEKKIQFISTFRPLLTHPKGETNSLIQLILVSFDPRGRLKCEKKLRWLTMGKQQYTLGLWSNELKNSTSRKQRKDDELQIDMWRLQYWRLGKSREITEYQKVSIRVRG